MLKVYDQMGAKHNISDVGNIFGVCYDKCYIEDFDLTGYCVSVLDLDDNFSCPLGVYSSEEIAEEVYHDLMKVSSSDIIYTMPSYK